MFIPNRENLAWAAGFFDGEGTTSCVKHLHKYNYPVLVVAQSEPSVLLKFQSIFGMGKVNGPYKYKNRPNNQPYYQYRVHGFEKVQAIVAMMWNWLGERKKAQAIKILSGVQ